MSFDIATLETDFATLIANAQPVINLLEGAAPVLELILPANESAVVAKVIGILKTLPTAAPNFGADVTAVANDVKAILAAIEAA
jgi:hypothetical protein